MTSTICSQMRNKFFAGIALTLFLLEALLCFVSWIVAALNPEGGVRSIFSGEGVRWLLGEYSNVVATPVMSWILCLSMAWGTVKGCGILRLLGQRRLAYRERIAVHAATFVVVACLFVVFLLAAMPHAVLLSATGELFPSPFSSAIVPVLSFCVGLVSVVFGIVSSTISSVLDVYKSLIFGIERAAPLFVIYILLIHLYYTLGFVLC